VFSPFFISDEADFKRSAASIEPGPNHWGWSKIPATCATYGNSRRALRLRYSRISEYTQPGHRDNHVRGVVRPQLGFYSLTGFNKVSSKHLDWTIMRTATPSKLHTEVQQPVTRRGMSQAGSPPNEPHLQSRTPRTAYIFSAPL
jgi:hypothetical protein